MKTHELKCWPEYFLAVASGLKTFEFRRNDRNFKVGDFLKLKEYDPARRNYSDREVIKQVSYITLGSIIPIGFCVMGIIDIPKPVLASAGCSKSCYNCDRGQVMFYPVGQTPKLITCVICDGEGVIEK